MRINFTDEQVKKLNWLAVELNTSVEGIVRKALGVGNEL